MHLSLVRPPPNTHTHKHTTQHTTSLSHTQTQRYAHMLTPSSKATGMHTNHLMTTKCGLHWYHSLPLRCLPVECLDLLRPAFSANHMLKGKRFVRLRSLFMHLDCGMHSLTERGGEKNSLQTFSKPRFKPQPAFKICFSPLLTYYYRAHLILFSLPLCFLLSPLKPCFLKLCVMTQTGRPGSFCSWLFFY